MYPFQGARRVLEDTVKFAHAEDTVSNSFRVLKTIRQSSDARCLVPSGACTSDIGILSGTSKEVIKEDTRSLD